MLKMRIINVIPVGFYIKKSAICSTLLNEINISWRSRLVKFATRL